ncbi:MAG TPA: hypothetical protein DGT23_06255, partial [Micromonosporaceae bacterium]|nr:hypothetical protein [Micromonosporaceae bacterium]
MRYADWGERSARWAGIRSELVDVHGTSVHLLRADARPDAPPDAPTQLLIHPMASGAMFWLDVMRPLTAYGPVVAPDLPGAAFGHTASPHRYAARAQPGALFLRAMTSTVGLDHLVVHGWSFGGLVGLLFADLEPARVQRLVFTDPTLPGPMSTAARAAWQTLGRLALLIGPVLVGGLISVLGPALVDTKRKYANQQVSRCSPELATLIIEQLDQIKSQPRLHSGMIAFASAVSAMYINRHPAQLAIDRLAVPTLLLWGDQDPLIEQAVIDHLIARRPDWDLHTFQTVGHLPPWEV